MSLTEEVFDYLEEEQERRGLTTRQDTVEAVIRENMRSRRGDNDADQDDEREVDPPLAAARSDLEDNSTLLAVGGMAAAAVALAVGGTAWVLTAATLLVAAVIGTASRYQSYRAQEAEAAAHDDDGGDTPAGEPAAD